MIVAAMTTVIIVLTAMAVHMVINALAHRRSRRDLVRGDAPSLLAPPFR
jgi:hypothetical protein